MGYFLLILPLSFLAYFLWQRQELKKFEVTRYQASSRKINHKIKIVVISDLHSFSYGEDNGRLFEAVKAERPDMVLVPGDLIVGGHEQKYEVSRNLLRRLLSLAPVVLSNGNHESRVEVPGSEAYEGYMAFKERLKKDGVCILNNESRVFHIFGNKIRVSGLEIPLGSYKKGRKPYLDPDFLEDNLGKADEDHLQLLLAHNPSFSEQYAAWGADIALCGHNHGGLIRIPGIGSLISPQFELFPKYDAGEFEIMGRKVYVSRGLGTHTFHIRIFNRAELLSIVVVPQDR